jgi:hypothetical protein
MLKSKLSSRKFKESEKGTAVVESIPVLFLMVLIMNFSLGFFGAIHTGILNSIGAYNYTIETFRYRSNLMYFRPGAAPKFNYSISHNRVHGILTDGAEKSPDEDRGLWPATIRPITLNYVKGDAQKGLLRYSDGATDHNGDSLAESTRNYGSSGDATNVWTASSNYIPQENTSIQTPRVWVKTVYGMCIDADCGDN